MVSLCLWLSRRKEKVPPSAARRAGPGGRRALPCGAGWCWGKSARPRGAGGFRAGPLLGLTSKGKAAQGEVLPVDFSLLWLNKPKAALLRGHECGLPSRPPIQLRTWGTWAPQGLGGMPSTHLLLSDFRLCLVVGLPPSETGRETCAGQFRGGGSRGPTVLLRPLDVAPCPLSLSSVCTQNQHVRNGQKSVR